MIIGHANNQKLAALWAETETYLEAAAPEIFRLMKEKFAHLRGRPESGSALDQACLRNGADVVRDLMENNEFGVALEHLCYMVEETDLSISAEPYASLIAAERTMQMDIPALRRIKAPLA